MRRLTSHLAAVTLLALVASQLHVSGAQACIKFDRTAETVLINEAIAAQDTSDANKAALSSARTNSVHWPERPTAEAAEHGEIVWDELG